MKEKRPPSFPIVMTNSSDPVGIGLAQSLARPGGNVTGISIVWEQLMPKWIELLARKSCLAWRVSACSSTRLPRLKDRGRKTPRRVARTTG
jgi:putative ABC transport system substrate-binding protein